MVECVLTTISTTHVLCCHMQVDWCQMSVTFLTRDTAHCTLWSYVTSPLILFQVYVETKIIACLVIITL